MWASEIQADTDEGAEMRLPATPGDALDTYWKDAVRTSTRYQYPYSPMKVQILRTVLSIPASLALEPGVGAKWLPLECCGGHEGSGTEDNLSSPDSMTLDQGPTGTIVAWAPAMVSHRP